MSESQTVLVFNLKFSNINFPCVRKRSRMEKFGHFRCRQYFEGEKIKRSSILVLIFYQKNKDFNNHGNLLRMTEEEDISSCYFTIEETWSR